MERLDIYLARHWPEYSRSTWQKYCASGYVKVNGEIVTAPKKPLHEDDVVTVDVPPEPSFADASLPVLYEDDNVVVINKPTGVLTHPKGAIVDEYSVAAFMRERTDFDDSDRPGIVHRLDRDTSGVMIMAKNQDTLSLLARQFAWRKAKKTYYAIVYGTPKEHAAIIDLPIARHPKAPSTFRVHAGGKAAQTQYEVVATHDDVSLLRLQPLTGRTHQLRVHLAYIDTPIVGDRVYGKAADRLYLHAQSLEITIPPSKRTTFTAPLPEAFTRYFPEAHIDA